MLQQVGKAALERLRSSVPSSSLARPPCILSARTVATTTTAEGDTPAKRHLMSRELLGTQIRTEAGLGNGVVGQGACAVVVAMTELQPCAMFAKRTAVHRAPGVLERLHEVRLQSVLQQGGHGAHALKVGGHGRARRQSCSRRRCGPPKAP